MLNEVLYVGVAVIGFSGAIFLARLGKEWLYGLIGTCLILVSTFGGKLVEIFGFITNAGNIFYATVFVAVFILLDRFGPEEARKGIWFGFAPLVLFVILSALAASTVSTTDTKPLDTAIHTVFSFSPRVFLASVLAYFLSLYVLVWSFELVRKRAPNALALRIIVASIIGQALDSVIFFSIAFMNLVPSSELLEIMFVGFLVKVVACICAIPFIHTTHLYSTKPSR